MKILTVPSTMEAMKKLDFDECDLDEQIELSLSENEYTELWKSGILDTFNQKLDLLIDDFEDESITTLENLKKAKDITSNYLLKTENNEVVKKLLDQIELAIKNNTGLFFYF